ncbi:hypothetical protein DSO57_1027921 [Entomophthora muscae]|uniref:Uncharacterized protein n=1 Tax=Entomophthora muscae TaxID=34485 RepID=A0ACC2RSP4_9FUNG|nr:hypothetical protein DSO57_1027921 [Entomophthora muscae]
MDKINELTEAPKEFIKESIELLDKCAKPTQKEFVQICRAVSIGFVVMGFIGYFVKVRIQS